MGQRVVCGIKEEPIGKLAQMVLISAKTGQSKIMSLVNNPYNLRAFPPSDRKLIVIYSDDDVARMRAERSWWDVSSSLARTSTQAVLRVALGPVLSVPIERAIDEWDRSGLNGIRCVTAAEFERACFKHPGSLEPRLLYVCHPKDPGLYYPAAHFHWLVFEHKVAELLRLLVALGASEVVIEHEHGWQREAAAGMDFPVPEMAEKVNVTAKANATTNSNILFKASYPGSNEASVPEGMVWFRDETLWREVADSRVAHGMKNFSLHLCYDDDFGVNAKLIGKAQGLNIGIGGSFTSHIKTVWKIAGQFGTTRTDTMTKGAHGKQI